MTPNDLDSFEDIDEWLRTIRGNTTNDDRIYELIIKTILRLPYDVRKKIIENEVLFIFGSRKGECFTLSFPVEISKDKMTEYKRDYMTYLTMPVILLNLEDDGTEVEQMGTIAHKIALVILEHLDKSSDDYEGSEKAADDLIEKWGIRQGYRPEDDNLMK
jgi:hypothetical protein